MEHTVSENPLQHFQQIEARLRQLVTRSRKNAALRVLLTGGTGTLGTALTSAFLAAGYEVTSFNRDPQHRAEYAAQFPQVSCVLGDICDYATLLNACAGQDVVIHAAALKRVDTGEQEIAEFARVNIEGTRTVALAASDALVDRAIFISSDKAVSPLNFYGMTKAVGERLWTQRNERARELEHLTRFSVVRYGNVMGSNGSVVQLWRQRLAQGLPIGVREPETTRFFMRVEDAVQLVFSALAWMTGGEIFVPSTTPAFALNDLAREVVPAAKDWQMLPLGPREKQHEVLLAPGEYAEACSETMVRVWPDRPGPFTVPPAFNSATARRLTGAETTALLG
jgi:UDP-N-acetylglucosamine 4,6-dehydratase